MSDEIRQKKMGRLIQKELGKILQFNKKFFTQKEMVTVTGVRMSPDLGIAKVYISMALVNNQQTTLEKIRATKGEIRKMLGAQVRKQVRLVPDLLFFIDDVEDHANRIEQLIQGLHIPPARDEDADVKG